MNKTLNIIAILFTTYLITQITSCDPVNCRKCNRFNFDIKHWSKMDDTVSYTMRFVDEALHHYNFRLISVDYSQPYEECEITSSSESVVCTLNKTIEYTCDTLGLTIQIVYNQYENLNPNNQNEKCLYFIKIKGVNEHENLATSFVYIDNEDISKYSLTSMPEYQVGQIKYQDVYVKSLDKMIVFETLNTPNSTKVDAKFFKEIVFQIPNGIVGLTLENGDKIIRVK